MWPIAFLVLALAISPSFGCSCFPRHIQNAFCVSDIVIKGIAKDVRSPETTPIWERKKTYDVEILEIFKAPTDLIIAAGEVISAVTMEMGSLCGGNLLLDTELLITGSITANGEIRFGLCSYIKQISQLTSFQLKGLRGSYTCECDVTPWTMGDSQKSCSVFEPMEAGPDMECLHKFGQCVKNKDGLCKWDVEADDSCTFRPPVVIS